MRRRSKNKVKFAVAQDVELTHKELLEWLEDETPIPVARTSKLSARMFGRMVAAGSLMPMAQRSELQTRFGKF